MRKTHQPNRWEAVTLAAAMAIAGTLFLVERLGVALANNFLSWDRLLHSSPILLTAVAACVFWAEQDTSARASSSPTQKEGR